MKIVVPGGTGHVGAVLRRAFAADGHEVVVLSRDPAARCDGARVVAWDPRPGAGSVGGAASADSIGGGAAGAWVRELDGADVVVNLAGRSVDCRYTAANRRAILDSRVDSTRAIAAAVAAAATPPRVWLQASTATIWAHRHDADNDEATGILGGDEPGAPPAWRFSIDVAKAWERAATERPLPRTRLVLMRSAMTMSADRGSVFDVLLRLVRFGLGGTCGDGRQFVSWIHEHDFANAVRWLIARDDVHGPVNLAAPHPLPNAEFMRALRAAWGTRIGLPSPRWLLELGAFVLRTESELVLKSRRVVSGVLRDRGFSFAFPHWPEAARELCARWRRGRAHAADAEPSAPAGPG